MQEFSMSSIIEVLFQYMRGSLTQSANLRTSSNSKYGDEISMEKEECD